MFDGQSALAGDLAQIDKSLCADFIVGQASPAFLSALKRVRPAFAAFASATLAAMVEGGASPVERTAPTSDDFASLEAELRRRGLGDAEIAALLDGAMPDPPLPDGALCDAGLAYFDALKSIEPAARARVYALAISASAKQ